MPPRDAHRAYDLAQLRKAADDLPLIVGFDEARRVYTVHAVQAPAPYPPLIAGRFQIAHTFIVGFARGWLYAKVPAAAPLLAGFAKGLRDGLQE